MTPNHLQSTYVNYFTINVNLATTRFEFGWGEDGVTTMHVSITMTTDNASELATLLANLISENKIKHAKRAIQ